MVDLTLDNICKTGVSQDLIACFIKNLKWNESLSVVVFRCGTVVCRSPCNREFMKFPYDPFNGDASVAAFINNVMFDKAVDNAPNEFVRRAIHTAYLTLTTAGEPVLKPEEVRIFRVQDRPAHRIDWIKTSGIVSLVDVSHIQNAVRFAALTRAHDMKCPEVIAVHTANGVYHP